MTTQSEGVITYRLDHRCTAVLDGTELRTVNAWRTIMHRSGLIGQDQARYGGYGYGNISCRRKRRYGAPAAFIISASQTGHLAELSPRHYCLVQAADIGANHVTACGPQPPSSEALTHAILYQQDSSVAAVIHAHCPEIWLQAAYLNIPRTRADAPCGTPAMALEIQRLFAQTDLPRRRILAMGGHPDGIVSFGVSPRHSAFIMLQALARALMTR